jgi:WS/DGAT/MGAT family acyltransferase
MHRMSGQDASFLYNETPTVLMHTLKIQIFDSPYGDSDYELLHGWLESALHTVPMLRQRVMFVPGNIHHPVMVDDPNFDLESHIYRAALPAPGGKAEFDQMISQILCHRLDRQRPLWELWALTGLEGGRIAIVHKIHHCLADGAATVRYLARVFEHHAGYQPNEMIAPPWEPQPLPSGRKLVWQALVDHFQRDIRRLPAFLASMWQATRNLIRFNREVGSPTVDELTAHPPPRTRFNHSLSARRNFTTRQIPLADVKSVGKKLGGTVNDVVLALGAGAVRNYLLFHDDLPDEPLHISVPVSADEAGETRESGNRTSYFPTRLWTNIADPVARFHAIKQSTDVGKRELEAMGKSTFVEMMHFLPPAFTIWKSNRKQRLRLADRPDYKPQTNMIVSNVPGPQDKQTGNYGILEDLYSMGPLVEGCGLNITAWSYAGSLNVSIMSCKKAIPDLDRMADGLLEALAELQSVPATEEQKVTATLAQEGTGG